MSTKFHPNFKSSPKICIDKWRNVTDQRRLFPIIVYFPGKKFPFLSVRWRCPNSLNSRMRKLVSGMQAACAPKRSSFCKLDSGLEASGGCLFVWPSRVGYQELLLSRQKPSIVSRGNMAQKSIRFANKEVFFYIYLFLVAFSQWTTYVWQWCGFRSFFTAGPKPPQPAKERETEKKTEPVQARYCMSFCLMSCKTYQQSALLPVFFVLNIDKNSLKITFLKIVVSSYMK